MRSCPSCARYFDDLVRFCPRDGVALGPADPLIGQVLDGTFELRAVAGEGASGKVYRGWQAGVERPVAVKILSRSASRSPEFCARFLREARAAARLDHPHIITVFTVGKTADDLPYIVMEWVEGEPLDRAYRSAATSPERLQFLARQIASALAEAHEAGIIHRDLKPANVMVSKKPTGEVVKILDFGIAKVLDAELLVSGETALTRQGVIYGTPEYLSPEQAMGQGVDARSDVYSLGVMLYELIANRLPFESQGMGLLVDHMHTLPPPLASLAPEAPPALVELVESMLAKDPGERPADAMAVLRCLEEPSLVPSAPPRVRRGTSASELGLARTEWQLPPSALPPQTTSPEAQSPPRSMAVARATRRAGVSLLAAILALVVLAMGGERNRPAATARGTTERAEASSDVSAPAERGPQQALMVASDGYSLRVLMPESIDAGIESPIAIDVWGPDGMPIDDSQLVVVFTDAGGVEHGVSAAPAALPGRYELAQRFDEEGSHSLRILPARTKVDLQVFFEVAAATSDPNS